VVGGENARRCLTLVWLVVMAMDPQPAAAQRLRPTATVTFPGGVQVRAEVVDTPETIERGLMFRESLGPNEGMLFVFEKTGFYPFWMKNTLIPLDIIWIDEGWRIVSVAASVPPCRADPCPTYPPAGDARYVVEVVAGFARTHRVAPGSRLSVSGLHTGRQAPVKR
jgi:uncharacterized membrane protein (UPF0127 family)